MLELNECWIGFILLHGFGVNWRLNYLITRQDQQIVEKARTLMYPNKGKKRLALEVTDTTDNTDGTNGTDGGEEKRMKTGQPTFKEPLNPPSEDK